MTTITLGQPYDRALETALRYIRERYEPRGILVTGTIVRGTSHPSSDLDIVVVHPHPWRQRTQRIFETVPAEIFVNPRFELERELRRNADAGRPVMLHMIATGVILDDPDHALADLQVTAREMLATGPTCSTEFLTILAYGIATGFEDAVDIAGIDPDRASALVTEALVSAARLLFLREGRWRPREKVLLEELDTLDAELGALVRRALNTTSIAEQIELATPVIERAVGATGFFEWETAPQQLTP